MTRPLVMGVVNATPDSFSDGGQHDRAEDAITHGLLLREQGADLLDVGGESTRPGAQRPSEADELRRVLPVVEGLVAAGARVSVDTMRAAVASVCLEAGAEVVNDVSGGQADPGMAPLAARTGAPLVVMHWRGHSSRMQSHAVYQDVVAEVREELLSRVRALTAAGVREEQIILDPGYGFAKTPEQSWRLLAHLDDLVGLGFPVLVGTSRKTFLGRLGRTAEQEPVPPSGRDAATAATSWYAAQQGAWAVRVHDVVATRAALDVLDALEESR